ncbi:uncharacterized protein LY89DRAFT_680073 [Mollisia scopiformis]|uniref:DUF3295 domain-containing protein n=1 Tax=Mollisia scopiformis TaxID=149040 RepID=A0A194XSY1_MOLSC|nr:uncharacterized protein LY89DRAFT_680073 [Mollisia scopiformis]KUJ23303.1 hypothetical protein LY89DRAFT_680073 [Mollisia scopiformis]
MEVPFYTLSSAGSSSTEESPLTPPTPATHDTSRSTYHISDISAFADTLQDAANQAFPNRGRSRYHTVNVCLIRWQEDELQVKDEIETLCDVFDKLYGFNTEIWLIPSTASQIQLTSMTCTFLQKFDEEGNLFIVYYGGHGKINNARQNQWWCKAQPDSPVVDWSAIQTLFGTAVSDVLILLDCCAAASSAAGSGSGTMEAIAACGWETRAPPPGKYSFTHTLIEVLEDWANKPSFSAAMLHTEVLFVLKQKRPEKGRDGRKWEWCSTPIHWVYTRDPKAPGIEISSLLSIKAAEKAPAREELAQPRSTSYIDAMDLDDEETFVNPLTDCRPNGDYKVPHVLISIALEGDQGALDAVSCRRWLADFPALAKYATVEGVYKGYSTLLTLSVPVMIWDLLPAHPACSFIGYIVSPNKCAAVIRSGITSGRNSFSSMYQKPPYLCRTRKPDTNIRSADSSYGSDGGSDAGSDGGQNDTNERPIWVPTRLEDISDRDEECDSSECAIEDDSMSEWEDSIDGRSSSNNHDVLSMKSSSSKPSSKSLITSMLTEGETAKPIDIGTKGQPSRERYRSADQIELSPRSVRRNMLASELSASLRRQMLWERDQGGMRTRVPLSNQPKDDGNGGVERKKRSNSF